MRTITFYSYKGGVGRTMSLANVAWRLAQKGKRVGLVDLDLEAPGLSLMDDFTPTKKNKPSGLHGFLNRSEQESARDQESISKGPKNIQFVENDKLLEFGRDISIGPYCHWVEDETFKSPGIIVCLPVGKESVDLESFIGSENENKILAVRDEFETIGCEYLLIDSRTGITATSRIANILYPDQVIMVFGLNRQNILGTFSALREFKGSIDCVKEAEGITNDSFEPASGDLDSNFFYLLPSLVPYGEEALKQKAFKETSKLLTKNKLEKSHLLTDLSLPYHPQVAIEDRPMLVEGISNFLSERYDQLTDWIITQNKEDPLTRIVKANALVADEKPLEALQLIGALYERPPFEDNLNFLKLYANACVEAGFTVEADAPLLRAMEIERQEDQKNGGKGLPKLETVLLLNSRNKKSKHERSLRLPILLKAKNDGFREDEDPSSINSLYGEIKSALEEDPIDIPTLIEYHSEVAQNKPEYAAYAASFIANFYIAHGEIDGAYEVFQKTAEQVKTHLNNGIASPKDLAFVYEQWAVIAEMFRHYDLADQKLSEAAQLHDTAAKMQCYLKRAQLFRKKAEIQQFSSENNESAQFAEIEYLESILSSYSEEKENIATIINRLAQLYESTERLERALELRRTLLRLEPWNRRDGILRVWKLIKDLN
ncbi:MAG: AAA family ATPase, partial [Opitutales bacterium]|nr:AAA family ATPase [Opitutales bacterium]